ncbi:pentapeptide repeat-containing protein [Haliangium ochraceum]|uniref:Pentapeptide repeat protein n=1 Tax=Haliangium ochraceum (strain DSM 14365 / JCM 11303 / SMP-2) TaxID=502025 RepID=D0LSJ4_HALO1|nr:pentapeptide repeat-containing protein [Haliangium ochraceum]ACY15693.1 pentapeptide repeat protein [Haliangium ochraceum DSM 14365]
MAFKQKDLAKFKKELNSGSGLAGLWAKTNDPDDVAVLHLAMVTCAFGSALHRYWRTPAMVPEKSLEALAKHAGIRLADDGSADKDAVARLARLCGNPLNTPYYCALWEALNDPATDLDAPTEPREFESHFRRAYSLATATDQGQIVQRWLLSLADESVEVMRRILAEDLAAWGERHVFGNVRKQSKGDPMPFLGLDASYVEPYGEYEDEFKPILKLIGELLEKQKIVVVSADFGHGKSLTARRLARDTARAWLESDTPSPQNRYPVFIKCARDIRDASYKHDEVARRALWEAATEALGEESSSEEPQFQPPDNQHAALFILDGLDEVAFSPNQLEDLFRSLREKLGKQQRAIIFTRPSTFDDRHGRPAENIPLISLLPFDELQIEEWLTRWNNNPQSESVNIEELREHQPIAELAHTPILLLMIAMTWQESLAKGEMRRGVLYEQFFRQIARGKYESDSDKHPVIRKASELIADRLTELKYLDAKQFSGEERSIEAMLWLMSRIAWEAHAYAYEPEFAEDDLSDGDIEQLLKEELNIRRGKSPLLQMGLLLALQFDPSGSQTTVLFEHQSFREFLVARYWQSQLLFLTDPERDSVEIERAEKILAQTSLLQDDDRAFDALIEGLQHLEEPKRTQIKDWAAQCLKTRSLTVSHIPDKEDRAPILRESALAIGSTIFEDSGLSIGIHEIRYSAFWHDFHNRILRIIAPNVKSPKSNLARVDLARAYLAGADLAGADLAGADLSLAHLERASLERANFRSAKLLYSNLRYADLRHAGFEQANLVQANLIQANFGYARFLGADLRGAQLLGANLQDAKLQNANLQGANLQGANLQGAKLQNANLQGADLQGADLRAANLSAANFLGAQYSTETKWPDGVDPEALGCIFVDSSEAESDALDEYGDEEA